MNEKLNTYLECAKSVGADISDLCEAPVLQFNTVQWREFIKETEQFITNDEPIYLFTTKYQDIITVSLYTVESLHRINLFIYSQTREIYYLPEGPITRETVVNLMSLEWREEWLAFKQWKSQVQDPEMPKDTL